MAKKRIGNYVFFPGVANSSNAYPSSYSLIEQNITFIKKEANAYISSLVTSDTAVNFKQNAVSLLTLNKTFLQDEITAWIAAQVASSTAPFAGYTYDADKCKRDVGYIIDGYIYDLRYGGNEQTIYNAKQYWLSGTPQVDGDRQPEVFAHTQLRNIINNYIFTRTTYTSQQSPVTSTQNVVGLGYNAESDCTAQITALAGILTTAIASGLSTIPSLPTVLYPKAVDLLRANKNFLKDEIAAWIYNQVATNQSPFVGYTYDVAKCKRDAGYIIDAYIYDLKYGGNEKTREVIQLYWINGVAQVDGSRAPEVAAHTQLRDIINNYIIANVQYSSQQNVTPSGQLSTQILRSSAGESAANARITTLAAIVTSVIANGLGSLPANSANARSLSTRNFAGYIYDGDKCERDLGYVLNAYLHDLRYGGNQKIRYIASRYWDGTIPQVDGDRIPEIVTHEYVRDLINNYILTNNTTYSPLQVGTPRQLDLSLTYEPASVGRINDLVSVLTTVVENSLTSLPDIEYGVTTIKLQGLVKEETLLLITNLTHNTVMYNFADPNLVATVSYDAAYNSNGNFTDEDFAGFYETADYVTTVELNFDASSWSSTDEIQIFVDVPETITRPYDFGTDAIERNRVAAPQSMLDADFEYGLQPTKWQAIGIARGYPSVYEVPGTDQPVSTVVTDASAGTSGVGQSLITVTTTGAHGYTVGTPFTIRALANTISGFSRAEGTFLVNSVPTSTSFTYYSVARVGTSNGQVLATTYTQLRKGAFYTGASIGTPAFSVYSNGQSGTITTQFITPSGSDQLAFTGVVPSIGSPISGTGIASGSQITGNVGNGGIAVTATIGANAGIGDTSFLVTDSTGILEGMAINNGTGTASFVSSIAGTTINLTSPLTAAKVGDSETYTNVSGSNINPAGIGAEFLVSRVSGVYTTVSATTGGSGYKQYDRITILGTDLQGASPANDITVTVSSVDGSGGITGLTFTGTSVSGDYNYLAIPQDQLIGTGSSATFDVTVTGGVYSVSNVNPGTGYIVGEKIVILGTNLGGASPANDLTINVDSVGATGDIASISFTGTGGPDGTFLGLSGNQLIGVGLGATFDILRSSGSYTVTLSNAGSAYGPNEQIVILGTNLGGTSTTNDLTITIDTVDGVTGAILTFTPSGTAATSDATFNGISGTNILPIGTGASFDISRAGGTYTTVIVNLAGTDYFQGEQIKILGTSLGGATPEQDAIVTIATVSAGGVATATITGTAISAQTINFYSTISFSEPTTASIANGATITISAIAKILITFATNHGLVPGANMLIDITSSGTNHDLCKGPFYVEEVPALNQVIYTVRAAGTVDTGTTLTGIVYARPDSYFVHRPFDGGVQLGTGGPQHGVQAIRMSKKYIRYQSGKGIMYTTGALFAPSYNLQSLTATGTAAGSFITVTTDDVDHGCQVGGVIKIVGVDTNGYNGTYTIVDIVSERVLKVQAYTTLGNNYATVSTSAQMSVLNWHGATVRAGTFDDQNGMFWQYDGQYLSVGRRTSTFQLAGTVSVTKDTNTVTGTNTRFRDQLKTGDKIVIRGMTHTVTSISSQTALTVTPDYRGASSAVQAKACLIQDYIWRQYEFNKDTLDGTGQSGYNVDITRMQMIGMQWSWYGAGFIDYMLRGSDGNYVFCHRIRNSNVNTEAYMRTGNMPVRYEVINESAIGKLKDSITSTQTTIPLVSARDFPNEAGIVYIDNELIAFTGKSGDTLTGCTRAAPMVNFVGGAQRTFRAGSAATHEYNTGVILVSNTISPIISHWGSAMLTDGRFDEDRGYLFNYASTGIQVSTTKQTAFLIRLAPSVSNAIIGDLGDRELINRAQLLLKGIEITSDGYTGTTPFTGGIVVEGVLNPQNYPTDPANITWNGLAGSSAGGQPSFAQIAPGGSVSWSGGGGISTSTATTTATLSGTASVPNSSLFQTNSGSNIVYFTKASWETLNAALGYAIATTETKFTSGSTITSITANPSPVATTLGLITGTATVPSGGGAFGTASGTNYRYFTQSSWQSLGAGIGSKVYLTNIFPAGTTVTNVTGPNFAFGQSFYTVTFSQNSTAGSAEGSTVSFYEGGSVTNSSTLQFTQSSWTALPISAGVVGNTTNDTGKFVGGTTISSITLKSLGGTSYYQVVFSNPCIGTLNAGTQVTLSVTQYYRVTISSNALSTVAANATVTFTPAIISSSTSFLFFTKASWDTLVSTYSAGVGTEVADPTKFPSGTKVSTISASTTFAGTQFYRVNFNQSSVASISGGSTVTFQFGLPPYAQPGETIFSFVAAPGTSNALDLQELKELTNTTLGGRGTYPNGPDVLAINVYRASGSGSIPTNIVLRWGEAQA